MRKKRGRGKLTTKANKSQKLNRRDTPKRVIDFVVELSTGQSDDQTNDRSINRSIVQSNDQSSSHAEHHDQINEKLIEQSTKPNSESNTQTDDTSNSPSTDQSSEPQSINQTSDHLIGQSTSSADKSTVSQPIKTTDNSGSSQPIKQSIKQPVFQLPLTRFLDRVSLQRVASINRSLHRLISEPNAYVFNTLYRPRSQEEFINDLINEPITGRTINQTTNQSTEQPIKLDQTTGLLTTSDISHTNQSSDVGHVQQSTEQSNDQLIKPALTDSSKTPVVGQSIKQSNNQTSSQSINQIIKRSTAIPFGLSSHDSRAVFLNSVKCIDLRHCRLNRSIKQSVSSDIFTLLIDAMKGITDLRLERVDQIFSCPSNQSDDQSTNQSINQSDLSLRRILRAWPLQRLTLGGMKSTHSDKRPNDQSISQSNNQTIMQPLPFPSTLTCVKLIDPDFCGHASFLALSALPHLTELSLCSQDLHVTCLVDNKVWFPSLENLDWPQCSSLEPFAGLPLTSLSCKFTSNYALSLDDTSNKVSSLFLKTVTNLRVSTDEEVDLFALGQRMPSLTSFFVDFNNGGYVDYTESLSELVHGASPAFEKLHVGFVVATELFGSPDRLTDDAVWSCLAETQGPIQSVRVSGCHINRDVVMQQFRDLSDDQECFLQELRLEYERDEQLIATKCFTDRFYFLSLPWFSQLTTLSLSGISLGPLHSEPTHKLDYYLNELTTVELIGFGDHSDTVLKWIAWVAPNVEHLRLKQMANCTDRWVTDPFPNLISLELNKVSWAHTKDTHRGGWIDKLGKLFLKCLCIVDHPGTVMISGGRQVSLGVAMQTILLKPTSKLSSKPAFPKLQLFMYGESRSDDQSNNQSINQLMNDVMPLLSDVYEWRPHLTVDSVQPNDLTKGDFVLNNVDWKSLIVHEGTL